MNILKLRYEDNIQLGIQRGHIAAKIWLLDKHRTLKMNLTTENPINWIIIRQNTWKSMKIYYNFKFKRKNSSINFLISIFPSQKIRKSIFKFQAAVFCLSRKSYLMTSLEFSHRSFFWRHRLFRAASVLLRNTKLQIWIVFVEILLKTWNFFILIFIRGFPKPLLQ